MNIRLLGTGSIWAEELGACALIDDTILLDCPNGLIKIMRKKKINISNIDVCIITHFHADHYFDIPFLLLEQGMKRTREQKFKIIGPKGLKKQIYMLFSLAYPELWKKVQNNSKLEMIEVNDEEKSIVCGKYIIVPYKMNHNQCIAYGYMIQKDGITVGFTGDTLMCPNVKEIVRKSKIAFVDMSFKTNSKAHMGVNNIVELKEQYATHLIVPTHMSDDARVVYNQLYDDAPNDDTNYNI